MHIILQYELGIDIDEICQSALSGKMAIDKIKESLAEN